MRSGKQAGQSLLPHRFFAALQVQLTKTQPGTKHQRHRYGPVPYCKHHAAAISPPETWTHHGCIMDA